MSDAEDDIKRILEGITKILESHCRRIDALEKDDITEEEELQHGEREELTEELIDHMKDKFDAFKKEVDVMIDSEYDNEMGKDYLKVIRDVIVFYNKQLEEYINKKIEEME